MSQPIAGESALVLSGSAVVRGDVPNPYAARVKTIVRYADPMAWALVLAVGEATAPLGEAFEAVKDRCSLIQLGPEGPREAMAQVASEAQRGFASPIRFPSSTPSAPAGLACIVHGLRGPTLALTLPVQDGVGIALALSASWLSRGVVDYALIGTAASVPGGPPHAGCVVLTRGTGPGVAPELVVRTLLPRAS
ncbi:coronafacic acid synthetase [Archangium sp. Cb G35]|uniref:coronafacic acid synthetase n=1 Tax=Archangium sp. Cb G35 TaxID=1920190 RepID=UPI00093638A3|nr:coronafacic acid synthetase [Archangium sp. Cb G35]OJT27511.1 coronafacic acid synthetase [Archangium sp. Cb G35]